MGGTNFINQLRFSFPYFSLVSPRKRIQTFLCFALIFIPQLGPRTHLVATLEKISHMPSLYWIGENTMFVGTYISLTETGIMVTTFLTWVPKFPSFLPFFKKFE